MGEKILDILIEGGKATAGPPLGPELAPLGINIANVVTKINEETKSFAGLKIPVKITVDIIMKSFTIKIGAPPTSELIKKAAGIEKGTNTKDKVGNISMSVIVEIAKSIKSKSQGKTLKEICREVIGTCISIGITIDNKDGKQVEKEIKEDKYSSMFTG